MAPSNQDSYFLQEPKTRLHSGITGPKMAADTPYRGLQPDDHEQPAVNDYSGLQVVETGLEVVHPSPLPEALPPHQQQAQYGEYKPWAQYSPPQPPPPHPGYAQPAPIGPGSTTASPPYGGGIVPDYRYHGGHNPFEPPRNAAGSRRICGLRRMVFWAVVAIVVFAIVAAVAIGVGVGLGTRSSAPAARCVAFSFTPVSFIFSLAARPALAQRRRHASVEGFCAQRP